jgi:hypothetical protein
MNGSLCFGQRFSNLVVKRPIVCQEKPCFLTILLYRQTFHNMLFSLKLEDRFQILFSGYELRGDQVNGSAHCAHLGYHDMTDMPCERDQ